MVDNSGLGAQSCQPCASASLHPLGWAGFSIQQHQTLLEKAAPRKSYQGGPVYRAENSLEDVIYTLTKGAPYHIQSFLLSYTFPFLESVVSKEVYPADAVLSLSHPGLLQRQEV